MGSSNFEALVERFYQHLYRFALSLAKNEADACDLTQQTFALWLRKGHMLRDPSKVKSWLFPTLYREFLAGWRHQSRFPHQDLEIHQEELQSVEPSMVDKLDGQTVLQLLTEIDEVYRIPLTLFYLEDLSYKEIAEVLDAPMGTVMSRISRGKQQLRQKLVESRSEESKNIPFPGMKNRMPNG
jgi:RNA polymerase sigma-70 factor (ECF subfamily)